jgi:CcmD family protein
MKTLVSTGRMMMGALALVAMLAAAAPAAAQQTGAPAAPAASQDGFVPVDRAAQPQETMPAATLVAVAYGFAWVMLFGYLWSIWSRLGKVERELQVVSRRVTAGGRQG